ncbi:DUF1592 domain-containing protein [Mariniblastus sp.]|nr:DUF1592 domain-containing protein [Mariniblastus sp.]
MIQFACLFLAIALTSLSTSALAIDERIQKFTETYCNQCHGETKQKAGRRFDTLPKTIETIGEIERYQEILDQLNLQSMPPEGERRPIASEQLAMIEHLTERISAAHQKLKSEGGHSVLRRINAWEYQQTIGDLLALNVEAWNPAENFPTDEKVNGFDNNGQHLVTSGILLEHYLAASEKGIARATQFGRRPVTQKLKQKSPFYFNDKQNKDLPKLFQVDRFRFIPETPYTDLYGRHYRGGHIGFLPTARGGLKHSGTYTIRVRAAAVDRIHNYGKALGDFRSNDPLVLEIASVDRKGSDESTGNVSKMIPLKRVELLDDTPQWIEWTGYLEAGFEPEIRFRNGPIAAKRMVRLLSNLGEEYEEFRPFVDMKPGFEKGHGVLKAYRGPKLRIWEIEVEGPKVTHWPPRGHQKLYGKLNLDQLDRDTIRQRLHSFAETAFRRPVSSSELEPIQSLVASKINTGLSPLAAAQLGFQAILCSPGFLYLDEGQGELDDYALASRLSYFLWSSMPDSQLLHLAAQGKLRDKAVLRGQITRMVNDPKSNRFVSHFIRRWLELDNIGEMPPSEEFLIYYRDNLEWAMRSETETFFRHILDNNLPLSEFLSADYSFLNRELAAHYGINGIEGNHVRQVSVQETPRRGLIGHGLFLTASANGVDTSPVVRGVYVLDKILGYQPPPPPPDIPEIEPDIRGAATIRDELAKHRNVATCAECHRKIDPLGFALENFNAIGGWREQYENRLPIDPSGKLPTGNEFHSFSGFRDQIKERDEQFSKSLTEKLLTYASGRELNAGDRPAVDTILETLQNQSLGFQELIQLICESSIFKNN